MLRNCIVKPEPIMSTTIEQERREELSRMTTEEREAEAAKIARLHFLSRKEVPSRQRWQQIYDAALAYTLNP